MEFLLGFVLGIMAFRVCYLIIKIAKEDKEY